jgi:hypothetical protein
MTFLTSPYLNNQQLSDAMISELSNWKWQWFVTLTFPVFPQFTEIKINKLLLQWKRKLCTQEKIQLASEWVLVVKNSLPHVHLLMVGSNLFEKTLNDVDEKYWESQWGYEAKIEKPISNDAVVKYFVKNLMYSNSELNLYNVKLLKKLKRV